MFEGSINFLRKLLDYTLFFFHKYVIFVVNLIGEFWNFCPYTFETSVCSYARPKFNAYVLFHFFPSSRSLEGGEISRNLHIEIWSI